MMLLGRVFDREPQAQAFVDYYLQQMRRVYNVTSKLKAERAPVGLCRTGRRPRPKRLLPRLR